MEHGLRLSQSEEVDELSLIDNHPGDMGAETFDKGRRYALVENEENIIARIDNALERIEHGTYGQCERCGKEIPEERLDFVPYATTCVECESEKADYTTYRYDRPVEEEVLLPYGANFMDVSGDLEDEIEYDGEDAWQDVSKYNFFTGRHENYYDEDFDPDKGDGLVEFTDGISNQQYRDQLP
jgi:YteA family regulatory protein